MADNNTASAYLISIAATVRVPHERDPDAPSFETQLVGLRSEHSLREIKRCDVARMMADFLVQVREQVNPTRARNATSTSMKTDSGLAVNRLDQHLMQIHTYLTTPVVDERGEFVGDLANEMIIRCCHAGFDEFFKDDTAVIKLSEKDMANLKRGIVMLKEQEAKERREARAARGESCFACHTCLPRDSGTGLLDGRLLYR